MITARRTDNIPCLVEIEQTPESLHANVTLEGYQPEPGDKVIVHGAPTRINFGEKGVFPCTASVIHAGLIGRQTTRLLSYLELTELYEIGFSAGEAS
jgi:hypothetical protein